MEVQIPDCSGDSMVSCSPSSGTVQFSMVGFVLILALFRDPGWLPWYKAQ